MAETNDPNDVAERLRPSLFRLTRVVRQQDEGRLRATLAQALITIALEGPIAMKALAHREQLSPPSITRVVEQLEGAGLIARETDPADRRVCRVRITRRGRRHLEQNRARRTEWLAARLAGLDDDDLATLDRAADILAGLTAADTTGTRR